MNARMICLALAFAIAPCAWSHDAAQEHQDHQVWLKDHADWMKEHEAWKADHKKILATLKKFQDHVRAHDLELRKHVEEMKAHAKDIAEHEAELQADAGGATEEKLDEIHAKDAAEHEAIKKTHEELAKAHALIMEAISKMEQSGL